VTAITKAPAWSVKNNIFFLSMSVFLAMKIAKNACPMQSVIHAILDTTWCKELAVNARRIVIPVIQQIIVSSVIWIILSIWGNVINVLIHVMNVHKMENVLSAFLDIT